MFVNSIGTRCMHLSGTAGIRPKTRRTWFKVFSFAWLSTRPCVGLIDRRGKFRSFLLASLQKYLSDEADRARCLKRGGKAEFVHLDLEGAEHRYRLEPVDALTPEKIFDARWATALIGESMNRLKRGIHCPREGSHLPGAERLPGPHEHEEASIV
jgi:hypothetical protein